MTTTPKTLQEIQAAETAKWLMGTNYSGSSKPKFSFTRPADTTAYTLGDTVGSITAPNSYISVPSASYGVTGLIQGGQLISDDIVSGMEINCFLFSEDVTRVADNLAPTETFANISDRLVAVIVFTSAYPFGASNVLTGDVTSYNSFLRKGNETKLYPYFTAGSAFTPTSAQGFTLLLDTI